MQRTKIESYIIENDLRCEIEIDGNLCYCAIYEPNTELIKFHNAKFLQEAIEKALDHHRRGKNDKIRKS